MYQCKSAGRQVRVVRLFAGVSGIGDDGPVMEPCGHACSEAWRCEWLAVCPLDDLDAQ